MNLSPSMPSTLPVMVTLPVSYLGLTKEPFAHVFFCSLVSGPAGVAGVGAVHSGQPEDTCTCSGPNGPTNHRTTTTNHRTTTTSHLTTTTNHRTTTTNHRTTTTNHRTTTTNHRTTTANHRTTTTNHQTTTTNHQTTTTNHRTTTTSHLTTTTNHQTTTTNHRTTTTNHRTTTTNHRTTTTNHRTTTTNHRTTTANHRTTTTNHRTTTANHRTTTRPAAHVPSVPHAEQPKCKALQNHYELGTVLPLPFVSLHQEPGRWTNRGTLLVSCQSVQAIRRPWGPKKFFTVHHKCVDWCGCPLCCRCRRSKQMQKEEQHTS